MIVPKCTTFELFQGSSWYMDKYSRWLWSCHILPFCIIFHLWWYSARCRDCWYLKRERKNMMYFFSECIIFTCIALKWIYFKDYLIMFRRKCFRCLWKYCRILIDKCYKMDYSSHWEITNLLNTFFICNVLKNTSKLKGRKAANSVSLFSIYYKKYH